MTDILKRLKLRVLALQSVTRQTVTTKYDAELSTEAADTIAALTAERDALRQQLAEAVEALEPFSLEAHAYDPDTGDGDDTVWDRRSCLRIRHLRRARDIIRKVKA